MIPFFRLIALFEGTSFLVILLVTMPLKYIWQLPEPTFYVGMIHGVLFLLYVVLAFAVHLRVKWNLVTLFWVLIASLLPFGTFVADQKILKKINGRQSNE